MLVVMEGPRGGELDIGLQAYALIAMESFAKQLNINRLKLNIVVKFHHNLFIDGKKNGSTDGLCEMESPRDFIIDVALYGNWLATLAHEMVHVKQFARGELDSRLERWKGRNCSQEYWDQPWEVEARRLQYKMVQYFETKDL